MNWREALQTIQIEHGLQLIQSSTGMKLHFDAGQGRVALLYNSGGLADFVNGFGRKITRTITPVCADAVDEMLKKNAISVEGWKSIEEFYYDR